LRSDDDELWKQTARLFRRRPGWVVMAMPTPGMPTYWCFARGSKAELSVHVESNSIGIRLGDTDQIVEVDDVSELATWLRTHRPDSLQEPRRSVIEKLRAGKLFIWE
jgi:hypothetical protein